MKYRRDMSSVASDECQLLLTSTALGRSSFCSTPPGNLDHADPCDRAPTTLCSGCSPAPGSGSRRRSAFASPTSRTGCSSFGEPSSARVAWSRGTTWHLPPRSGTPGNGSKGPLERARQCHDPLKFFPRARETSKSGNREAPLAQQQTVVHARRSEPSDPRIDAAHRRRCSNTDWVVEPEARSPLRSSTVACRCVLDCRYMSSWSIDRERPSPGAVGVRARA